MRATTSGEIMPAVSGFSAREAVERCTPAASATCCSVAPRGTARATSAVAISSGDSGAGRGRGTSFWGAMNFSIHFPLTVCNRLHKCMQSIAQENSMDALVPTPPGKFPNYGIIDNADGVTDVVLAAMAGAPNPRLREVMAAFVRHLHAFTREVRVTQDEYDLAIDFLNRIGKATNDAHNEGILFADAVGFSTLVCLLNNGPTGSTETDAALLGPFWRDNSPLTANGGSIVRSPTPGPALFVDCRIVDADRRPIPGVEVDVWQASPVGLYENQDPDQADMNLRGRFHTHEDGRFWFRSVKPAGYPVPTDGP